MLEPETNILVRPCIASSIFLTWLLLSKDPLPRGDLGDGGGSLRCDMLGFEALSVYDLRTYMSTLCIFICTLCIICIHTHINYRCIYTSLYYRHPVK